MKKEEKSVSLKYDRQEDIAPRVTAKAKGYLAEKMKEIAKEHNVPIVEDPDLVEVLYALDLDTVIPEELYKAVSEVLAFIYRINGKL